MSTCRFLGTSNVFVLSSRTTLTCDLEIFNFYPEYDWLPFLTKLVTEDIHFTASWIPVKGC